MTSQRVTSFEKNTSLNRLNCMNRCLNVDYEQNGDGKERERHMQSEREKVFVQYLFTATSISKYRKRSKQTSQKWESEQKSNNACLHLLFIVGETRDIHILLSMPMKNNDPSVDQVEEIERKRSVFSSGEWWFLIVLLWFSHVSVLSSS